MAPKILSIRHEEREAVPARQPIPGLSVTVPGRAAGVYTIVEVEGLAQPLEYGPAPLLPFPATEAELLTRAAMALEWIAREQRAEGA